MKRLDRFIVKAYAGPFIAILLIVVFILMMQFLWLYIDELVGKGLGLKVILEFLFWGSCTILPLAIPLATLLSAVMTLGAMGENNELLAMRAAGVPITRVLAPLGVCAVLISTAAYFAGNDLVPKAYNEIYTLRDDIGKTKDEIKIPTNTFYEGIEGYILRVSERNDDSGMMYNVMVYGHQPGKGNTQLTLADSAMIKLSKKKDYMTFTLYDGSSYQEDNKMHYRDTILDLQRIDFDRQELIVPLRNYTFQASDSVRFSDQAKSMKRQELKVNSDSLHRVLHKKQKSNYSMLKSSSPFAKKNQLDTARRHHYDTLSFFADSAFCTFPDAESERGAYQKVKRKIETLQEETSTYTMNCYEPAFYICHTDVELLKKFAQALACLLMFLIGAPLGALISKGGLGASAIISVLFFVLYWVIDISGTKLANDGAVVPWIGVFVSSFVLFPIGVSLVWKASHDNAFFTRFSSFKYFRKMLHSKLRKIFKPVRIVYMGTPEFAVAPLEALISKGYKVVGIVTVADKPSGRGLKVNESAVKKYAVEHGIPVLQPLKLKDPEFLASLKAFKADMFVVVAFRMLPEEVWAMPKLGTFNLHAALLPQYRGAAPINWAVINGERHTGVTTFLLDKNIDTGGILLRQECHIGPEDTAGDIHDRLMGLGSELVVQTVEGLIQQSLEVRVQKEFIMGDEVLRPAPKLTPENTRIDWSAPASVVHNLVRGLSPYPGAWTMMVSGGGVAGEAGESGVVGVGESGVVGVGEGASAGVGAAAVAGGGEGMQLKIFGCRVAEPSDLGASTEAGTNTFAGSQSAHGTKTSTESLPAPGTIVVRGKHLYVCCGNGAVEITELQLSGKKRMSASAFLAGWRGGADCRLV